MKKSLSPAAFGSFIGLVIGLIEVLATWFLRENATAVFLYTYIYKIPAYPVLFFVSPIIEMVFGIFPTLKAPYSIIPEFMTLIIGYVLTGALIAIIYKEFMQNKNR